jgi:hypothetical protein
VANIPTVGVFIPNGYLNVGSSPGPTGQQDAYGQNYPTGLNPGKVIELSTNAAQALAATGTSLYDGAYQWVKLDSGATAAYAAAGMAAYIKLDTGAAEGILPETEYQVPSVTTYDQVSSSSAASLGAGVFLNPATYNGASNLPTPGQWIFIFVGAGRAQVNINTASGTTIGNSVNFNGGSGSGFVTVASNAVDATFLGSAVTTPSTNSGALVYVPTIKNRIPAV